MKVRLELGMSEKEIKQAIRDGDIENRKEVEEYLLDSLFEVCQDWALGRSEPDIEVIK